MWSVPEPGSANRGEGNHTAVERPPRLSIVIPAYNEAERLPSTLEEMVTFLHRPAPWTPAEIVVVDDGSSDQTAAAASRVLTGSGLDHRIERHPENRGKGAAVRTGMAASRGRWVLLADADLATPMEELEALWREAADRTVVIGSRAVDRRLIERRQPWYRDLMGRTFNLLVRTAIGVRIHDTQCGFKLFPGDLARHLAEVQRLDGFAFDVELLARSAALGYAIRETGVRWRHVEASRVSPVRHSLEMFRDLLRVAAMKRSGELRR